MSVVVLGLNHRTVPLSLLERVTVPGHELRKALHDVGTRTNVSEAVVLSTCNRTEVYVVAERFSSADFLHGPIAMIEPSFPIFLFAPSGVTETSIGDMVAKLDALKAETGVITDSSNKRLLAHPTRVIQLPKRLQELYTPIPYIIPAQIFAACLAAQKGVDPDSPRTLTKVTRTL